MSREGQILVVLSFLLLLAFPFREVAAMGRGSEPDSPGAAIPYGPEHGSKVVRVLSYNVHGLPFPTLSQDRYGEIGAILAERRRNGTAPQIVNLQEAFADRTRELNENAQYPYGARGPTGSFLKLRSGLLVLSEYPIIKQESLPFEECATWDCFATKGTMHVHVIIDGVPFPLEVYNTHLQSDPDGDPITSKEVTHRIRKTQVGELADFLFATNPHHGGVIFPSDFNFLTLEDSYRFFENLTGLTDAAETCTTSSSCDSKPEAAANLRYSVDHQFFMSAAKEGLKIDPIRFSQVFKEPVNGHELSDHFGIETDYLLTW